MTNVKCLLIRNLPRLDLLSRSTKNICMAGLAVEALEEFPTGPASVRVGDYQLDVLEVEGNTIVGVRVTPIPAD